MPAVILTAGIGRFAAPWPPDPCTLPRNTRFHCRIRVLDRVQRSPNGRYEAGKRRSTVDGGADPRCSFCRPGKDAVKTCRHAASSRDKGTRMAGPKTPRPSLKLRPSMPIKRAGRVPGHAAARALQTSAFRSARPRRAFDQASGEDTRSTWLVGMTCTSPEDVNAAACAMNSRTHPTM